MRFHFVATIDQETGELGWKDKRIHPTGPYGPLAYHYGLAHDCLEHFSLTEVSDEIEAHGALFWGRYQGGWCNEYGGNLDLDSIGTEWISLARAIQSEHWLRLPPKTRPLDEDTEENISTIVAEGRRYLREEGFSDWQSLANRIENVFRGWFRIGFRKAARRWARWQMNPAEVSHLYNELAKGFEKNSPEMEGQELIVTIAKNGQIRFHEPAYEVCY